MCQLSFPIPARSTAFVRATGTGYYTTHTGCAMHVDASLGPKPRTPYHLHMLGQLSCSLMNKGDDRHAEIHAGSCRRAPVPSARGRRRDEYDKSPLNMQTADRCCEIHSSTPDEHGTLLRRQFQSSITRAEKAFVIPRPDGQSALHHGRKHGRLGPSRRSGC